MGKWEYRKPEPRKVRGICVKCNKNPQHHKSNGNYGALCQVCHRKRFKQGKKNIHHNLKGDVCEKCGFIPEHPCQLDLDHIDGNNKNYSNENLQTLCANCHRLKTFLNEDYK